MLGATLQRATPSFGRVKVITRVTVIDSEDISASQLLRDIFDPFQRSEVHFRLVRPTQISVNCGEMPAQLRLLDWGCDESEPVARFDHASFLPISRGRSLGSRV